MEPTPMLCPRCQTQTIEHNSGHWCPLCGMFAVPPDPRHTAHLKDRPQSKALPELPDGDYYDDELGEWFIYDGPV